jgi:hypothetical protein
MKAIDLLKKDESAILIRTDGRGFSIDSQKSSGSTGVWRIDTSRQIHKVIIYKQTNLLSPNEIYIADHIGVSQHTDGIRHVISLANIQCLGSITENWYEFANLQKDARNPIRYLVG